MPYSTLEIEMGAGWAMVALNRPERLNAITPEMQTELEQALMELRAQEVRALIVTGRGRGFCSGADVSGLAGARGEGASALAGGPAGRLRRPLGWPTGLLFRFGRPTIAAVNGVAAGAGLSLALACDIRLAAESARFSAIFVRRGLMPDYGCTWLLPRLIGPSRAYDMMYTGRMVSAQEAERWGLVSKVVPDDRLLEEAKALASELAKGPPLALEAIKAAVQRSLETPRLEEHLLVEAYGQSVLMQTEDHQEGVRAFLEKREAQFKGR
ncbi:MAG: enoyl-CoA hydratase-related protein [Dehalococcoidia bacterium]|nr:enoyl-CoA hydratase-related protein [Dehalococcoidia bacterium]MDW8119669.1 enoyl-CoA hydratase-related protein [Chloroflexota bacterium]